MGQMLDKVVGGESSPQAEDIDENENKYKQTPIAKGAMGNVYRCEHKSKPNMIVLKKSFCLNAMDEAKQGKKEALDKKVQNILKASDRLNQLRHSHVVPYYWVSYRQDIEQLNAFMEFCPGGSLETFIEERTTQKSPFDENLVCLYLRHMASGLKFLHDNKIIHANIRPSNVLFTANRKVAKITDFGEGHLLMSGVTLKKGKYGPMPYMAPEMAFDQQYTYAVDVWSLGIVVHEMATLSLPGQKGPGGTLILGDDFMPLNTDFSDDLVALVVCMLTKTVDDRAKCASILDYSIIKDALPI